MKFNKKIFLALLSAALLGAGDSLIESQSNSALTVVQAAKKTKAKSKVKKSIKSKKKSKKSKKSTKKNLISTSKIYKTLFGKKSNDPTLEKYRDDMVKVVKKLTDRQNGKWDIEQPKYLIELQAAKNTHEYCIDYPMETDGKNPYIRKTIKIKKGELVDKYNFRLWDTIGDDNKIKPVVGVKKLFGKYYYWIYDDTNAGDNDNFDDDCDFYPVSDFKFILQKIDKVFS